MSSAVDDLENYQIQLQQVIFFYNLSQLEIIYINFTNIFK